MEHAKYKKKTSKEYILRYASSSTSFVYLVRSRGLVLQKVFPMVI